MEAVACKEQFQLILNYMWRARCVACKEFGLEHTGSRNGEERLTEANLLSGPAEAQVSGGAQLHHLLL